MADPEVAQAALARANEEKNLLVVYQPIHDARSGEIWAAEALLRQWRQNGEIREASAITQAAERGPELFKLDSFAVRTALAGAAEWHSRGAKNVRINVNLSPREFQEGNILPRLEQLVLGCGVDTHLINLEITETSYIDEPEETMEVLEELKKLGVQLWLDDFGTGHSSIQHLQHFPIDGIKLPAEFVRDVTTDRRCVAIARSLIALAHEIGTKVIAEGIEHQSQLDLLRDWQCDYIQGFLFSRPMQLDKFEQLLFTRSSSR